MGKGYQLVPYPLPSVTFAASGNATVTLRDLPKMLYGRIAHLAAITFEMSFPVTTGLTLSSGTATPFELQNLVNRLEIFDGTTNRFIGDFASLRFREAFENRGNVLAPEPDAVATTEAATFMRTWHVGPQGFEGAPSDFLLPCGALENGEIRMGFGAITDIDANVTAVVCTISPTAWLVPLDEIRVPPVYEWTRVAAGAADVNLTGRALYAYLGISENNAFGALTSLDHANVQVDTGTGQVVPNIHAAILSNAYLALQACGSLAIVVGDQRAATADSAKEVNPATPTALQASSLRLTPVLWAQPNQRITKLVALAESVLRVRWSGANTTGTIHAGRILEQTEPAISVMAGKALGRLGLANRGIKVKTLSKEAYRGPRPEFMPFSVKVR